MSWKRTVLPSRFDFPLPKPGLPDFDPAFPGHVDPVFKIRPVLIVVAQGPICVNLPGNGLICSDLKVK